MQNFRPYVAVSGVTTVADAQALGALRAPRPRRLVGAVLVSAKSLRGEPTTARYPTVATAHAICAAFATTPVVAAVHYNTRAAGDALDRELDELVARIPAQMLQFNFTAPAHGAVVRFRARHPSIETVLQVNPAVEAPYREPGLDFGDLLRDYRDAVDHFLLDGSQGRGCPLDPAAVAERLDTFEASWRDAGVGMGFAGGLGPASGPTLAHLRRAVGALVFDDLSWDAESDLRVPLDPANPVRGQDRLDLDRVAAYLALDGTEGGA